MSTDRDVERIVRSWMGEGVTALPDRVLDLVLDQIPATPQRRAGWLARRFPIMNSYARLGLVAAAALAAAIVGIGILGRSPNVGPPVSTPSFSASFSASPTPAANPLAGAWVAPDATCTQMIAAIEASGYTAEQMTSAGFDPTCANNEYLGASSGSDTLAYSLVLNAVPAAATIGRATVLSRGADISGPMAYRPTSDTTFEFGGPNGSDFEWCLTVRYVIEGDQLTVTKVDPGCSTAGGPSLLDQFAMTAVLKTSSFTRQQ